MKKYTTTGIIKLTGGIVGLTSAQAELRAGSIRMESNGRYQVMHTVTFKAGEIIGLEDVPKVFYSRLEAIKTASKKRTAVRKEAVEKVQK